MLPQPLLICHSAFIKLTALLGIKSSEKGDLTKTKQKQELLCIWGTLPVTQLILKINHKFGMNKTFSFSCFSTTMLPTLHLASLSVSVFQCPAVFHRHRSMQAFSFATKLGDQPTMENMFWLQLFLLILNVVKGPFNRRMKNTMNIKVDCLQSCRIFRETHACHSLHFLL